MSRKHCVSVFEPAKSIAGGFISGDLLEDQRKGRLNSGAACSALI